MPCQPSIPSHCCVAFSKIESMTFFLRALAQFDENKHGAEGLFVSEKGAEIIRDDIRRGEVEGCRPDRSKVWSFCCLFAEREKGNANSNSMMNEEKLQIEVSLMQPRKDAYAHTGLQDDEFQFLRESFADLFQRCTIDTNCGTQRGRKCGGGDAGRSFRIYPVDADHCIVIS
jgi:hypothetical protein